MKLVDQIPGLREAIAQEQFVRDAAFLGVTETICGIEVMPLTLRHLSILSAIGSPFVDGGKITAVHVGQFLWAVSPEWNPKASFKRRVFLWRCRSKNARELVEGITDYLRESMQDAPGGADVDRQSYYSFVAGLVDIFAHEYGWTVDEITSRPMKQLFQLMNAMKLRNNPDAMMFNPSDAVRRAWMDEQHKGRN